MRNRSSSKSMEVEKDEHPHLSGAYIRSLVKQLSNSSRAKGGQDSASKSSSSENGHQNPNHDNNNTKTTQDQARNDVNGGKGEETKGQQPYKKQVRRRLHTTRPYQERLLNMAEARREIVTALKIHRATMKQAKEKQQQQIHVQKQLLQQPQTLIPLSCNNPLFEPYREHPFNYNNFSNYLCNTDTSQLAYSSFSWPQPTISPSKTQVLGNFNLDLPFPSQPLGLNLNFQGFNTIDLPLIPPQPLDFTKLITQPCPTASSNYTDLYSSQTLQNYETPQLHENENSTSLHPVTDDEDQISQIYSLGEKHNIEWKDTVSLVTSAWWSKFLKNLEEGEGENMERVESHRSDVMDGENLHKPLWLDESFGQGNGGDFFDEQRLFGCHQGDYSNEISLPRLDIGEIEGWDEWLS